MRRSGRRRPSRRRSEPRKFLGLAAAGPCPCPSCPGRRGRRSPAGAAGTAWAARSAGSCRGAGERRRRAARAGPVPLPPLPRVGRSALMPPPPLGELRVDDLAVGLVRLEQLAVGADADDRAGVHDDDLVGVHDRADALGDDDHGRVGRARGRAPPAGARRSRSRAREKLSSKTIDRRVLRRSPGRSPGAGAGRPTRSSPPWVIGASRPPVHLLDEVACPGRSRGPATARRRSRRSSPKRRLLADGPAEQEGLLGDRARSAPRGPRGPSPGRRRRRRGRCPSRVVEARDEVDERRLAAAGAADDGGRLGPGPPGTRCRGGPAPRHRGSGTRRRGTRRRRARRPSGAGTTGRSGSWIAGSVSRTSRIRPEETAARGMRMNMKTAVRTANRICSRYCRNAVRLPIEQVARFDPRGPEPHDRDGREVEDRGHHRDGDREQPVDLELGLEQVAVGRLEARFLVARPHEGADDADAGQRLAHDLVDPVDLHLDGPEERDGAAT